MGTPMGIPMEQNIGIPIVLHTMIDGRGARLRLYNMWIIRCVWILKWLCGICEHRIKHIIISECRHISSIPSSVSMNIGIGRSDCQRVTEYVLRIDACWRVNKFAKSADIERASMWTWTLYCVVLAWYNYGVKYDPKWVDVSTRARCELHRNKYLRMELVAGQRKCSDNRDEWCNSQLTAWILTICQWHWHTYWSFKSSVWLKHAWYGMHCILNYVGLLNCFEMRLRCWRVNRIHFKISSWADANCIFKWAVSDYAKSWTVLQACWILQYR